jgi:PAS domain S-box-containing protein
MRESAGVRLPEGLPDAILEAARVATIGVALVALEEPSPHVVWMNDAGVEVLGWPRDELLSGNPLRLVPPEELPFVQERLAARARGEDPGGGFETVIVSAAGERIHVQVALGPVVIDGVRAVVAFFSDIRARKLAERALRDSEERFRTLVESAPDSVVITRMGVVLYANPAAATLLGYASAAAMQGLRIDSLLDDEGATVMMQRTRAMIAHGERFPPREYPARRTDGTWVVAEITSHPIEHDGAPAILAFARDVT